MTLSKRLIISGMIQIASILVITALLITVFVNRQFNQYVTSGYLEGMDKYHNQIRQSLDLDQGDELTTIGSTAVTEGYYLEILSESSDIIYASQNISSKSMMGRGVSLLQMKNMPMYSGLEVKSWAIETMDASYLLNIGYDLDEGLSEDARRFKYSVYGGIFLALLIGILFSYIGSRLLAKPMVKEIKGLKDGAKKIQLGQLSYRFEEASSIHEISELKISMNQMAATLLEQEEIRKELVATVNHEVKTPLTVLKSQIDAFTDGIQVPTSDSLKKCKDEIIRIETLMSRMEDYDQFTGENQVLNLSTFSLKEEVLALSTILQPQFDKKSLAFTATIVGDSWIQTDRYKLRQILYNLLSNAYKFSNEGTGIGIQVSIHDHNYIIDVSNQGLIIDGKEEKLIFDARYRAGNANKKDPHGRGLGLHISRTLANCLKGRLSLVQSNEEATVFRLTIEDMNSNRNEDDQVNS